MNNGRRLFEQATGVRAGAPAGRDGELDWFRRAFEELLARLAEGGEMPGKLLAGLAVVCYRTEGGDLEFCIEHDFPPAECGPVGALAGAFCEVVAKELDTHYVVEGRDGKPLFEEDEAQPSEGGTRE